MADVIERSRTNWFRTTDTEKLKSLAAAVKTDAGPLECHVEDGGLAMLCCAGSIQGAPTAAFHEHEDDPEWADDNPDEAYTMDAFLDELKTLVAPGEAALLMTVGHEAMRSVWADCYVIANNDVRYVSLDRKAVAEARGMLSDPSWGIRNGASQDRKGDTE